MNPINTASVKVMRSHDYCHFEVILGCAHDANGNPVSLSLAEIDELRKTAARLADKAVEQYNIAKSNAEKLLGEKYSRDILVSRMKTIEDKAEGDRTVREQAELKAYRDEAYVASREYDYEDQWDEQNS